MPAAACFMHVFRYVLRHPLLTGLSSELGHYCHHGSISRRCTNANLCHFVTFVISSNPSIQNYHFFTMTHEVTKVTSMVSKLTSGVLISHIFHIIPWQLSHCQKWPWPSVWGSRTPSNDPLLGFSDILGHSGVGNKYDMKWTVSTNDQPKIWKKCDNHKKLFVNSIFFKFYKVCPSFNSNNQCSISKFS